MIERGSAVRRRIPSVDAVLRRDDLRPLLERHGRRLVTDAVREALQILRSRARPAGGSGGEEGEAFGDLRELIGDAIHRKVVSSLRRVINATGVIVHTNLGRGLLSPEARRRVAEVASSYTALEYDLQRGRRGSRASHLDRSLSVLFPDHAALAVNNNAGAVLLALNTLAEGREVVISRGELVEIGGSFRIPDVMAKSGARLREVGTTNRTRLEDYADAMRRETGLLLKVHTSNYRIVGFTQQASVGALAELARGRDVPLMVDQGSGCLVDLAPAGIRDEPTVGALLEQGADVVTFSGDKVLGGPQAGIVVGRHDLMKRMFENPLYRVLRLDKLAIAALEATLDSYVRGTQASDLPVLEMIFTPRDEVARRAQAMVARLSEDLPGGVRVDTIDADSRVGGGAAPMQSLPTVLVRISSAEEAGASVTAWEAGLRAASVPVIAIVRDDALLLDLRTVLVSEEEDLARAVIAAVSG